MIIRIKRYGISLQRRSLTVWSLWPGKTYKMTFPIRRLNPFTYLKPIFHLLWRKFFPKSYINSHDTVWDMCSICKENVAQDFLTDNWPICGTCKAEYDEPL